MANVFEDYAQQTGPGPSDPGTNVFEDYQKQIGGQPSPVPAASTNVFEQYAQSLDSQATSPSSTPETDKASQEAGLGTRIEKFFFSPEGAQTVRTGIQEAVKAIPEMALGTLKQGYEGLQFAAGGPQDRAKLIEQAATQAIAQGQQMARDVQSPFGTPEWLRGMANVGMTAVPGLELFRELRGVKPVKPPIPTEGVTYADQPYQTTDAVSDVKRQPAVGAPEREDETGGARETPTEPIPAGEPVVSTLPTEAREIGFDTEALDEAQRIVRERHGLPEPTEPDYWEKLRRGQESGRFPNKQKWFEEIKKEHDRLLAEREPAEPDAPGAGAAPAPPDAPPVTPPAEPPRTPPPPDTMDSGEPPESPQETAAAERTRGGILGRVGRAIQNARDWFSVRPIPKLERANLGDSAYQHAAARNSVVHTVRDLLARVFPSEYKHPTAMNVTGDILVKDNILGLYDQAKAHLDATELGTPEHKAAGKAVFDIEQAHDLDAYDRDVQAAKGNKAISDNIERWKKWVNPEMDKMYGELKASDPGAEFEPRGRHFGARINLLGKDAAAELADFTDITKTMPHPSVSSYRNPNVKRDRFARKAKGTAQYSTDPGLILMNTIGGRWNEVTKLRFYNDIVKKGQGIINDGERPAVDNIGGEKLARLPIKIPETTEAGKTRQVEKSLWVKQSLVPEIKGVLDVDSHLPSNPVFRWLTGVQLLQATDMIAHAKNIHTVIANSLGSSRAWTDAVRKMPFLATTDFVGRIASVTRQVMSDTPAIRNELADMSRQGLLRPKYPITGIQKITRGQQFLHHVDTASRVIMNRFWNNLIERGMVQDTVAGRRQFVQQIGEYNRRLMGPTMRFLRDIGASPFVVAGRTFNRFSKKLLLGDPGFKAANTKAAIAARAQMVSGLVAATTVPAIVNYFTTGNFGGRPGTPVGAIDTGSTTKDGKLRIVDVFQLMGIRRGLRGTGAEAVIEGTREGKTVSQIGGKAIDDITGTVGHPWLGPGLGGIYSTISGKRLDLRGGSWPFIAKRVPEGGLHQYQENARVTLKNQNPLVYSLLAPLIGETEDTYLGGIGQGFLKAPMSAAGYSEKQPGSVFQPQYPRRTQTQGFGTGFSGGGFRQ